ncbi:rubredoxin [Desulfobulbus alkaliphilus]|nr:rubredoxin [Desulfobulbus alkaliphilus]
MNGVESGTTWEQLPQAWVCPMCYATKEAFDPLD